MNETCAPFIGVVAMCAANALALGFLSRRHRRDWCEVGSLEEINLFPMKSVGGIEFNVAQCGYDGLQVTTDSGVIVKDRTFMVVNSSLEMVTARQKPKLLGIKCSISDEGLMLNADGMETLTILWTASDTKVQATTCVWGDAVEGVDCGEEASEWMNRFLGTSGYKVLQSTNKSLKRNLAAKDGRWYEMARDADQVAFQDAYPFMMTTSSSLKDLNIRMFYKYSTDYKPITHELFRANLFVKMESSPFSEDNWAEIRIGECIFYNIKPCDRCIMTVIDPVLAQKRQDMEPLKTLRSFRLLYPEFGQSPCFGINLILIKSGAVRKGDKVFVKRFSPIVEERSHKQLVLEATN